MKRHLSIILGGTILGFIVANLSEFLPWDSSSALRWDRDFWGNFIVFGVTFILLEYGREWGVGSVERRNARWKARKKASKQE